MNIRQSLHFNKVLSLLVLLAIIAAVPLTVFIAQKQQEVRQQASVEQKVEVFFTKKNSSEIISSINLTPDQLLELDLYFNVPSSLPINAFDFKLSYGQNLSFLTILEGRDANKFENSVVSFGIVNDPNTTNILQGAKTTITGKLIGKMHIASIALKAKSIVGSSGNISFNQAYITSPTDRNKYVPLDSKIISYNIFAPTPTQNNGLGFTVTPANIETGIYQNKLTNIFNMTALSNLNYSITSPFQVSPANGFLGKGFNTNVSLKVAKSIPIDTYLISVSVKNNSNGKILNVPAKLKVLPALNYNKPLINSITIASSDPYDYRSQQVHVTLNGSGFNYNPTVNPNDPVYKGTIYRSLKFRDRRGIVTDQITLPSNNPLVNASWTNTVIQKKFVNKITFLEAYIEVYFYSASGKTVIAKSNIKRVF